MGFDKIYRAGMSFWTAKACLQYNTIYNAMICNARRKVKNIFESESRAVTRWLDGFIRSQR